MANKLYKVEIHQHEDWYFATCKTFPGLHVAHTSLAVVLEEIPICIIALLRCNLQQPNIKITADIGNKIYRSKTNRNYVNVRVGEHA